MAPSILNCGSSSYHSILALFCRSQDGQLLSIEGRYSDSISRNWPAVIEQLSSNNTTPTAHLPSGRPTEITRVELPCLGLASSTFRVREIYHDEHNCYVGLLSSDNVQEEDPFRNWMETLFVSQTSLRPRRPDMQSAAHREAAKRITELFESTLRNVPKADKWSTGRDVFFNRVLDFVARDEPVQLSLPSFPCKSPNEAKVGGRKPDMAERIALETLRTFVRGVEEIYSPGATLWVVHDGHVFSDCIGVDDDIVSEYESDLQTLYRSMYNSPADQKAIQFCGLSDLLFSGNNVETFSSSWLQNLELSHPIETKYSNTAELARKIMMAGCGIDSAHVRALIKSQDPATVGLYRGQSRFMLQDLVAPSFLAKSTSQRKKIASSVALEMIERNQAYSNLLELLFPNFVRLSIHAHSNEGPKFGIRLLPKNRVRAIDDIDGRHEPVPVYEFQVPTPWHNSIIQIQGDRLVYLAKSEVARRAISSGRYAGGWLDGGDDGGRFVLCDAAELCRDEEIEEIEEEKRTGLMKKHMIHDVPVRRKDWLRGHFVVERTAVCAAACSLVYLIALLR